MNQLTKAQITVGLLAFFATMWSLIRQITPSSDLFIAIGLIGILFFIGRKGKDGSHFQRFVTV